MPETKAEDSTITTPRRQGCRKLHESLALVDTGTTMVSVEAGEDDDHCYADACLHCWWLPDSLGTFCLPLYLGDGDPASGDTAWLARSSRDLCAGHSCRLSLHRLLVLQVSHSLQPSHLLLHVQGLQGGYKECAEKV